MTLSSAAEHGKVALVALCVDHPDALLLRLGLILHVGGLTRDCVTDPSSRRSRTCGVFLLEHYAEIDIVSALLVCLRRLSSSLAISG